MTTTDSVYPCLWFDGEAEAAAQFYCAVFKNSKILASSAMVVDFELNGRRFCALNGGPMYTFNEAVSFVIPCENQAEIDYYWEKLSKGGSEGNCGWLKDRFGISWQVIPTILPKLLADSNKASKVVDAFMKMKKFDIAILEAIV